MNGRAPTRQTPPAVSVSIGVAPIGEHGRELTGLLEAADTALYRAKEAGRARAALAGG
ncbi:MAG: diguanylate cyclase [Conexibacter sp.]